MLNAISLVQDLNSSRRVHFPTTITTTPRAPPKQSDGEVPVILELCGKQSTFSLSLHPGPFLLGMLAPDRVLSMGQIELFDIWTKGKEMTS